MIVYVIRDAEGKLLEICASVSAVFSWVWKNVEGSFNVKRFNYNFIIETELEHYEIVKRTVLD